MIKLENTKNLLGITVSGDWDDLNSLYDAISHVTSLFLNQERRILAQTTDLDADSEEHRKGYLHHLQSIEDNILGFMYDIRHSYQGDRDYEYRDNNSENLAMLASCIYQLDEEKLAEEREKGKYGNLYFKANFLYPWMLYYLVSLNTMINNVYFKEDYAELAIDYNEIHFRRDEGIIQHFLAELMLCLSDIFGENKVQRILKILDMGSTLPKIGNFYGMCLCNYYCDKNKNGRRLRKYILTALIYAIIGEDVLYDDSLKNHINQNQCLKDLRNAHDGIRRETGNEFLDESLVFDEINKIIIENGFYTDEDMETIADMYGDVDWDHLNW